MDANGAVHTAADSQYTLQLRETTLYCPRYNNTGGQVTVLIVQTAGPQESGENLNGCTWTADFYDRGYNVFGHTLNGTFVGSNSFQSGLATNGMIVVATPAVTAGTSGSIQIAHTCGYGKVQAKAVGGGAVDGVHLRHHLRAAPRVAAASPAGWPERARCYRRRHFPRPLAPGGALR